jgi:5'-3' exonuclease
MPKITSDLISNGNSRPLSGKVQLAYVLPKASHSIISNNNRELLLDQYSNLYPDKYETRWAFCRYLWESHVVLPQIDNDTVDRWENELQ